MPQRGATSLEGDAVVTDVAQGKTFYKDDPTTRLTGTLALTGDAIEETVLNPKTFYKDSAAQKTGKALVPSLTVGIFQANAATGTFTNPENINDNLTASGGFGSIIGEYAEVDFGETVKLRRFRHYGFSGQGSGGEFKIQVYTSSGWEDWKTGIPTRGTTWSDYETVKEVITSKIRVVCTVVDADKFICEVEIVW